MSQLEIIHLCAPGESAEVLGRQIKESIMPPQGDAETVVLYRRRGLDTDLVVHVHHRAATQDEGPSTLGLRLASALRGYGLVEHTLSEELT